MKTIKHLLIVCAAVVLLATLLVGCGDEESSGLEFELNEDGESYSVVGVGSCTDKKIVIPAEYEGKAVTGIGGWAFNGCDHLKKVIIPDSVTSIDECAFIHCANLTNIFLPDSVTNISSAAFVDTAYYNDEANWIDGILYINHVLICCKSDKAGAMTIKDGTNCIANGAFSLCYNGLTSIIIPDSVTSIGRFAFGNCSELESITIGNGVTSISESAFEGCSELKNVFISDIASWCNITFDGAQANPLGNLYLNGELITALIIPDSVTSISDYAFHGCTSLTSITIPNSVTGIGRDAFSYCKSLTRITIPDSVTEIGNVAFSGCTGLRRITIPDSVTEIGNGAFRGCTGLGRIIIPDSVTEIGNVAFSGCTGLMRITIPDSVTEIGNSAFYNCYRLTSITYTGTKAQWTTISKDWGWNDSTGSFTVHCTDGDISYEDS